VTVAGSDEGATIEVRDTGVGIEPDELPLIFERFYRGTLANEARASGSGLGLAIVRSIVDMHRGTVAVSSTLGVGTTFTVHLPADPRSESVSSPPTPTTRVEEDVARPASPDASTPVAPRGELPQPLDSATNVADSSPSGRPRLNGEASG
jgi:hypothetical protein